MTPYNAARERLGKESEILVNYTLGSQSPPYEMKRVGRCTFNHRLSR